MQYIATSVWNGVILENVGLRARRVRSRPDHIEDLTVYMFKNQDIV